MKRRRRPPKGRRWRNEADRCEDVKYNSNMPQAPLRRSVWFLRFTLRHCELCGSSKYLGGRIRTNTPADGISERALA